MATYRTPGPIGRSPVVHASDDGPRTPATAPGRRIRAAEHSRGAAASRFARAPWDANDDTIRDGPDDVLLQALQEKFATMAVAGVHYRLIPSHKWSQLQPSGRYQIVDLDVARGVLQAIARESGMLPVEAAALQTARQRLIDARRGAGTHGLLLLRIVRAQNTERRLDEPALTPSQLARLRQDPEATAEDHWIGIELLWDDGNGIEGARYVITTPDGRIVEGVTNAYGLAHVEGILSAGQCKIEFPDIDQASWASS